MSDNTVRAAVRVMTSGGPLLVTGLSPEEASLVGRHHNAIRQYTRRGDPTGLGDFSGLTVGGYELETRLDVLDWWAMTDELDYESIYEQVG